MLRAVQRVPTFLEGIIMRIAVFTKAGVVAVLSIALASCNNAASDSANATDNATTQAATDAAREMHNEMNANAMADDQHDMEMNGMGGMGNMQGGSMGNMPSNSMSNSTTNSMPMEDDSSHM